MAINGEIVLVVSALPPVSCLGSEGGENPLQLSEGGGVVPDRARTPGLNTATLTRAPSPGLLTDLQLLDVSHQLIKTVLRVSGELLEGVQYGAVPSAAANVAVQDVVDLQLGGLRVFRQVAVELHHHPRGAVAALSAPGSSQGLLYGVIALALPAQSLHRGDLPPGTDVDRGEAGVH